MPDPEDHVDAAVAAYLDHLEQGSPPPSLAAGLTPDDRVRAQRLIDSLAAGRGIDPHSRRPELDRLIASPGFGLPYPAPPVAGGWGVSGIAPGTTGSGPERRRPWSLVAGLAASAAVILLVIVMVAVTAAGPSRPGVANSIPTGAGGHDTSSTGGSSTGTTPPTSDSAVQRFLADLSVAELDKVGVPSAVEVPEKVRTGAPVQHDGHPAVMYDGAEYCPYCAFERWPIIIALSKFGAFSKLSEVWSSGTDVYPYTPTFTFYRASFKSSYITFVSAEVYGVNPMKTLQKLTAFESSEFDHYDAPPYTSETGAFPFVDFGNLVLQIGSNANSDVQSIMSGLNQADIAQMLTHVDNPVTQAILGTADYMIASVCYETGFQPAVICHQPFVSAALHRIGIE